MGYDLCSFLVLLCCIGKGSDENLFEFICFDGKLSMHLIFVVGVR